METGRSGEPERQLPGSMLVISVGSRSIGTTGRRENKRGKQEEDARGTLRRRENMKFL